MKLPNMNGVPIIGQQAASIPAQLRLDARELVAKTLDNLKNLGLRFGRIGSQTPIDVSAAQYLLALDALEQAGCRIVSVTEHIIGQGPNGAPIVLANILFRAPDSLFAPSVQA